MKRIERLRLSALKACKFRGHDMTRFKSLHSHGKVADCKICGDSVYINSNPAPNDIDIGGRAVAVYCRTKQESEV